MLRIKKKSYTSNTDFLSVLVSEYIFESDDLILFNVNKTIMQNETNVL